MSQLTTEAFTVSLGGYVVAHLFQRGDYTWLDWQEGYWDDPTRPVLGLHFENQRMAKVSSALRLPTWFSNLLPEGKLRDWVADDAKTSPDREMMLLRRLGSDLPGAVTVRPATENVDPRWGPDENATAYIESAGACTNPLKFSLAGVALKFSMLQSGNRLTLPARNEFGNWIVKFPDFVYMRLPENEFATMSLAREVGINIPEIGLSHRDELPDLSSYSWPMNQELAYTIRRFDRNGQNRIHMEDLAQVKGVYPDAKYDGSFTTLAALVYRGRDTQSYLEFVRRLFFSFAVGHGDMHLKNLSLLYPDGRRPVLSPAYDLVCTAPYRWPSEEDMGLRLGRSRRFSDVTPYSFEAIARRIGASAEDTLHVVSEVACRLLDAWHATESLYDPLPEHKRWLESRLPAVSIAFR